MSTTTSTPTSPQPDQPGVLEHIDPRTLIIETNVRTEQTITLEPGFIDSIRANGVLVPVLAWRDTDGTVHVRAGQRRALAAREAGVATIPVYVVTAPTRTPHGGLWSSWSRTNTGKPSPTATGSQPGSS